MKTPNFLTHYYDSESKPFLNIMDLFEDERLPIITSLNSKYEKGLTRRAFPEWYLIQRKNAEKRIRELFIEKGGKPNRNSPHYFCLGKSNLWTKTYLERTKFVSIPISNDEPDIFYSIGDSLWCFAKSEDPNQKWENQWFQGTLFTLDEVEAILEELEIDLHKPETLQGKKIGYIEAFIWCDKTLNDLLIKNNVSL